MKNITPLILILTLWSALAQAQGTVERAEPIIYAITADGNLNWYRHTGFTADIEKRDVEGINSVGLSERQYDLMNMLGANRVGTGGWQQYKFVFANRTTIYGVTTDGKLNWYKHTGGETGTTAMQGATTVGLSGWQQYKSVFAGGSGIIYAITADGNLNWYKHTGAKDGTQAMQGAITIGFGGWQQYKSVFTSGNGIIYAITPEGNLNWYRHVGHQTGSSDMIGAKTIAVGGWQNYKFVFAYEDLIYAVSNDGNLYRYRHIDYMNGGKLKGRQLIGQGGWNAYVNVFGSR